MTLFRSLRSRSFALLWSGQAISRLGDSLYQIALAWWVLEKTGSATVMGTVLIFSFTPMLLLLLVGGVTVDRLPRVLLLIGSDLLRGLIVVVITILAFAQLLEVWHVLIASALFGLVDAFFQPAYTAMVPDVTPVEALSSANSLTAITKQLSRIAGPALGAAIISLGGTGTAFALDALSFFISAACIAPLIGLSSSRAATSSSPGILHDIREGFQAVIRQPWLWITITLASLGNITHVAPVSIALPFLVKESLKANVTTLGLIYSMIAFGSFIAAVLFGNVSKVRRRGLILYGTWILLGLMICAFGLQGSVNGVLIAALVAGISLMILDLIWTQMLQELVPRNVLGRVSSIDYLGSFALLPVGYAIIGWATDQIGPSQVFMIGGLITAGIAFIGLFHPAIRKLD